MGVGLHDCEEGLEEDDLGGEEGPEKGSRSCYIRSQVG